MAVINGHIVSAQVAAPLPLASLKSMSVRDFHERSAVAPLGLTKAEQDDLVAFMKALTDERVRLEKAPFVHPQLFVSHGHPGDTTSVTNDGTGKATDSLQEIPPVGRNGGNGTPNFLQLQ